MMKLEHHDRYDYIPLPERPDYAWPDGRKLALCICNNAEIFSFRTGLGSDSAVLGAPQSQRNFAWRDYGNRVGQWYLFDLLDEMQIPASHSMNAVLARECPQIVQRILDRNDEIIAHGRTNAERQDVLSEDEERALILEVTEALKALTGRAPKGWMGPYLAQSDVTLDLLKEAGYQSNLDWPADDQPFRMRTRSGPILSVPYSIELNDSPSMIFRQESSFSFERMIVDQFDEMLLQSEKNPLVCIIVLHSFIIGYPFRLRALRALDHILESREKIWITTPGGIADYCANLPRGVVPGS